MELWAEPANPDDADESGMNFDFWRFGAKVGDLRAVRRPPPDYPIRRMGTGQNVPGDKRLYRAEVPIPMLKFQ